MNEFDLLLSRRKKNQTLKLFAHAQFPAMIDQMTPGKVEKH
jgi:hypothetical protein